jgi:hypothetical protein
MRWKTLAAAATLAAFAVMPLSASAQDTGNTDQVQIFTTMPQPEQGYATTLYRVIPVADQPAFITWLGGFQPEQQVLVIRTLHAYSTGGPNVTTFTTDTTPDVAMPVFVNVLGPTDQPNFRTFWGTLTPEQQTAFITYARDVYTTRTPADMGNQGDMGDQPTQPVTTNETSMTTGAAGQPMATIALNMATVFAPFLPEADRTTFTNMASSTPPAELGGMAHFLSTLTSERAGMVVRMISKLNEMGMSGTHMANEKGISDYDAKKLLTSQLDSGDMTGFESMYSGMDDQQRTTLLQLARDAYNGGLNDLGATMTSSSG